MANIIGLSGFAGCGKDLFFKLFQEEAHKINKSRSVRVALADPLKEEVKSTLLQFKGIDPTNCSRHQKDIIRDLLIFYGLLKRNESEGRYWVDKASEKIKDISDKFDFILVTDIRFNRFIKDEVSWVKDEWKGKLLVIKQFVYDSNYQGIEKLYQKAPNKTEEENMVDVESHADYILEWPFSDDENHLEENLRPAVRHFLEKYYEDTSK